MKRNYVYEPMYEMIFEMMNGETFYLYGKYQPKIQGSMELIGDCIPLYSKRECERLGMAYEDVLWIDLPYGDYQCEYEGGLIIIKKDDKIILMFYRNQLKKCTTNLPEEVDNIKPKR